MQNRLAVVLKLKIYGWVIILVSCVPATYKLLRSLLVGHRIHDHQYLFGAIRYPVGLNVGGEFPHMLFNPGEQIRGLKLRQIFTVFWMHTRCEFSALAARTQILPLRTCISSNYSELLLNNSYFQFRPMILIPHVLVWPHTNSWILDRQGYSSQFT